MKKLLKGVVEFRKKVRPSLLQHFERLTAVDHNSLSQKNVLKQIDHLKSYPEVAKRVANHTLRLHAWWFEIKSADVYAYDFDLKKFEVIDEKFTAQLIEELEGEKK